jgi:hypothetical protein
MNTRRYFVTLLAGTALAWAATTESPAAAVPDGNEPVPTPETIPADTPKAAPEREVSPEPEAAPEPTPAPKPQSTPEPTTRPTGEPAQQPPPPPAPEPQGGGTACTITSAGLICPGDTDCVITSTGVNCASNCVLTSAGLSCPKGEVQPNTPRGEVLPNPPVSGGPRRTPGPTVKAEGEESPTVVSRVEGARARELPFTGVPVPLSLAIGGALLAAGLLLRRSTAIAGAGFQAAGESAPLAVAPGPPQLEGRPPTRWTLVLPPLALLACGMLLFRRTRR